MQLAGIHEYLTESSVDVADSQVAIVLHAVDRIAGFPEQGRPGRRRGTRELVITGTPYTVAYRLKSRIIEILAILHGARRWPRSFS